MIGEFTAFAAIIRASTGSCEDF